MSEPQITLKGKTYISVDGGDVWKEIPGAGSYDFVEDPLTINAFDRIASLEKQLAAARDREGKLRDGLESLKELAEKLRYDSALPELIKAILE